MARAEGELQAAEASGAIGAIRRRQMGPPWYLVAAFLMPAFAFAGLTLARFLPGLLGEEGELWGALAGGVVGGLVYVRVLQVLAKRQFRARLASRGLPLTFPVHIDVGEE